MTMDLTQDYSDADDDNSARSYEEEAEIPMAHNLDKFDDNTLDDDTLDDKVSADDGDEKGYDEDDDEKDDDVFLTNDTAPMTMGTTQDFNDEDDDNY